MQSPSPTELSPDDLTIINTGAGFYGGGFKVNSILMKTGVSPLTTLNGLPSSRADGQSGGAIGPKVSDLFKHFAVPVGLVTGGGKAATLEDSLSYNVYGGDVTDSDSDSDISSVSSLGDDELDALLDEPITRANTNMPMYGGSASTSTSNPAQVISSDLYDKLFELSTAAIPPQGIGAEAQTSAGAARRNAKTRRHRRRRPRSADRQRPRSGRLTRKRRRK